MGRLIVLMVTAFVDMMGNLIVFPLVPFYAERVLGHGPLWRALNAIGLGGAGAVVSLMVMMFAVAQLLSSPMWGRFSDRVGRRPALMIALGSSAIAFIVFAYSSSLELLFLCRIIQGAGGGTVGVVQAYVADATKPEDRAKALGWLSAATNAGVAIGPAIGAWAMTLGVSGPGLVAAAITVVNMTFAWKYLAESNELAGKQAHERPKPRGSREAVRHVLSHGSEPASRLIWIYGITMGSFQGMNTILALFLAWRFGVTEKTIGYFFTYVGVISFVTRAVFLGKLVDWLGEPRLSRVGMVFLAVGLAGMAAAPTVPILALAVACVPLGAAFTFPCVTGLLSRVVAPHERGLYMGVQQTFGGVGRVIGPLYAGFAFDHLGKTVPYYTAAAIVLATISLGVGIEKNIPAKAPKPAPA
ncbi:MAG TPA: MFS transporter [Gemmatimonadaceae bacterium]|nr:MFS transporter [Gemmatimonadaceae bacterium]